MNDASLADAKQLYADGEAAFANGDYRRALDVFAEVAIHPGADASTMPALHWNMALCQGHLGNLRAALEQASAGGNTEAELREVLARRGVSLDEDDQDARRLYSGAEADVAAGRYEKAVDAFVELFLHPGIKADQFPAMHHNVALCLAHLGQWDTALDHALQGGFDEASFTEFMANRGVHAGDEAELEARRLYAEANAAFEAGDDERCLELNAELMIHGGTTAAMMPALHWNMAMCLARMGRWETAIEHVHAGHYEVGEFEATMEMRGVFRPAAGEE